MNQNKVIIIKKYMKIKICTEYTVFSNFQDRGTLISDAFYVISQQKFPS